MGNWIVEGLSALGTGAQEASPDILVLKFTVVNAFLIGKPGDKNSEFALVDTGLENSTDFIKETVDRRFGKDSRPAAIILTHGHFDHAGSVISLSEAWDVPVYIYRLELPYISGEKDYPVPDASVGGGMVAGLSPTFPHKGINIGFRAVVLPKDGSVPGMPGWKWIHTPGHSEGHVSLFRESDRILIAGDALSTLKQESLLSVLTQKENISGPPKYLTTDWKAAEASVRRLRELKPSLVLASHGQPMGGEELTRHLDLLVGHFDEIAKPEQGRFIDSK